MDLEALNAMSLQLRRDVVEMVYRTKDGHPSPSFSVADIITALYFEVMNIDPSNPEKSDRDRFVLSKGHSCPVLYAALARRGYFPVDDLYTLRYLHSKLQGHPYAPKTKGLDATTGSLGNGVSIGLGMALAARIQRQENRVYVITGDGELGEGMIWEAAMAASHQKAVNLTVFIDNNNYQSGEQSQKYQAHTLLRINGELSVGIPRASMDTIFPRFCVRLRKPKQKQSNLRQSSARRSRETVFLSWWERTLGIKGSIPMKSTV